MKDNSRRVTVAVLAAGGLVVLGLVATGATVMHRAGARSANSAPTPARSPTAPLSSAPPPLQPSLLLADARRQASAWRADAVLIALEVSHLDTNGVAPAGTVQITYATPSGQRISGGSEANGERLLLTFSNSGSQKTEAPAGKALIAPEPNCLFEDAWASAQRAGAAPSTTSGMRYAWNESKARSLWELISVGGQVSRRLDGVTCSILTR